MFLNEKTIGESLSRQGGSGCCQDLAFHFLPRLFLLHPNSIFRLIRRDDYYYLLWLFLYPCKKILFFFPLKEEKRKLFFKSCQSVVVPIIHDTHTQWCIFEKFYCWKMLSFLSSSLKIKYTPKKYISIPLKIGGSGRSRRIMHSFLTLCTIRYAVIKSKDFSQFPYEYFVFTRD